MSFFIKHLLSQSPKVVLYEKPGILVAQCGYSIINSTTSSINNLYVNPDFRQEKYGSRILKFTESTLKSSHNITNIQLLAHELPHDNLTSFFDPFDCDKMQNPSGGEYKRHPKRPNDIQIELNVIEMFLVDFH